jgi:hypothetical protein
METVSSLNAFFDTALAELSCDPKTRSYIVSIFVKYGKTSFDLPNESITMTFFHAKQNQDFATFQSLGDWMFFCRVEFPEHLVSASDDFYLTVGQMSYLSCYKLLKRQWLLYQEMSDRFIELENETRELLTTATAPSDTTPPRLVW